VLVCHEKTSLVFSSYTTTPSLKSSWLAHIPWPTREEWFMDVHAVPHPSIKLEPEVVEGMHCAILRLDLTRLHWSGAYLTFSPIKVAPGITHSHYRVGPDQRSPLLETCLNLTCELERCFHAVLQIEREGVGEKRGLSFFYFKHQLVAQCHHHFCNKFVWFSYGTKLIQPPPRDRPQRGLLLESMGIAQGDSPQPNNLGIAKMHGVLPVRPPYSRFQ